MKKLEINRLSEINGGKTCFWLGFAAVASFLGGPVTAGVANGVIAAAAAIEGCFK